MNLAVDTNRYRDFCDGREDVVAHFQRADRICIPFPVFGELRAGFACGKYGPANERILNVFLNRPRVVCLFADEQTTFHYARLYRQLREQGTPIPTNDIWVAAIVQQHNLVLCSRDQHFDHLPQLARVG